MKIKKGVDDLWCSIVKSKQTFELIVQNLLTYNFYAQTLSPKEILSSEHFTLISITVSRTSLLDV